MLRNVNPQDLEQLAKLIDGKGGAADGLREAFTRAATLGVSDVLAPLRPMNSWVADTGPDLRSRAAIARLEDGDPMAGLRWAGFTDADLKKHTGRPLGPDALLLANSVAASDDRAAASFRRQENESLDHWIHRLESKALAKIAGLEPHEETVMSFVEAYSEVAGIARVATKTSLVSASMVKILGGNAAFRHFSGSATVRQWQDRIYRRLRATGNRTLIRRGRAVRSWTPALRSLSAPGTWLPGRIAAIVFGGSQRYQQLSRVPFVAGTVDDRIGNAWDGLRRLGPMNATWHNWSVNRAIDFTLGSDSLAKQFGGKTHSQQDVVRAGQARLTQVWRNSYLAARSGPSSAGRTMAAIRGAGTTGKVSGVLRGSAIVGGTFATYRSADKLWHRGNPADNFDSREEGASYVADVAELGFNASLTYANVSPGPYSYGATAVFGTVYLGAKTVEHWDDVKEAPGKAADWMGDKTEDFGKGAINKAKDVGTVLNPKSWGF
ncbi:PE-PGRS family protein [Streptomyces buecherae]|uniref:PE-PGRS family protein n=1 Tax=Streptomyces buecherae TaxID=2763006 RepID=UPI0034073201